MDEPATVLIIDDDAGMRLTLSRILTHRGHRVLCAENGVAGIAIAEEELVDLALVDYRMTGLNGGQVCAALSRARPEAKVYMMTAHVTEEAADSAVASGASGILYKPLDIPDLLALVGEQTGAGRPNLATQGGRLDVR
jgi:CheY-like chemotaxis protein